MLIFTKLIYLTNEAYFGFSASVFEYMYIFDCQRAMSSESVLFHVSMPTLLSVFLFIIFFFALPRSSYLNHPTCPVTQPVGVDGRQSTKQMRSTAAPECTHDTFILVLAHVCSVNETFHFCENKKVSVM